MSKNSFTRNAVYTLVAQAMKASHPGPAVDDTTIDQQRQHRASAAKLADAFTTLHPGFDRARFEEACGTYEV